MIDYMEEFGLNGVDSEEKSSHGFEHAEALPLSTILKIISEKKSKNSMKDESSTISRIYESEIFRELFLDGNMPRTQKYLVMNSFLGDQQAPDNNSEKESSMNEKLYFFLVSILCCINIVLRGVSQVYLCNNPISGVLICIGLYLTSPQLLIYGLVGTACGTLAGSLFCLPHTEEITAGLCG